MHSNNLNSILQKWTHLPSPIQPQQETQSEHYFALYSTLLNAEKLQQFQQQSGAFFQLLSAWEQQQYCVALLQGKWCEELVTIAHELQLDIAPLNFKARLQQAGLLVMDMDSTAIKIECIDEIAKLAGTGKLVSEITEQAMRGELDFAQSLRRRVATLKDAPESILQQVRAGLPLMEGLEITLAELQKYGWKTAIASGGFTYFADYLKDRLKLDFAVSNQFDIQNGKLTGLIKGDIVDAQYKANTLQQLADQFGIAPEYCVAIGDGANDLAMMKVAGIGIAFHAKPKVQQQAQIMVNFADLSALLCILSANDRLQNYLSHSLNS